MKNKSIMLPMVAFTVFTIATPSHAGYKWKDYFSFQQVKAIKNAVNESVQSRIASDSDWKDVIAGKNIKDESITGEKITDGSITTAEIANGSITAAKIKEGAVSTASIVAGSVTAEKIANDAITTAKIADGAVTTAELGSGAVSATKIADGAVNAAKIADGTITAAKVDNTVVKKRIYTGTMPTTTAAADKSWTDGSESTDYNYYYKKIDASEISLANLPTVTVYAKSSNSNVNVSFPNAWSSNNDFMIEDGKIWVRYMDTRTDKSTGAVLGSSIDITDYKIVVNY